MGGATSVMPVIRGAFSQSADTIDWTVRCDWLQLASWKFLLLTFILQVLPYSCGTCDSLLLCNLELESCTF